MSKTIRIVSCHPGHIKSALAVVRRRQEARAVRIARRRGEKFIPSGDASKK